jgi:hypothetical protein
MGRLFRAGESSGERSDRVGGSGGGYNWIEAGEEVKLANVGENGIFELANGSWDWPKGLYRRWNAGYCLTVVVRRC